MSEIRFYHLESQSLDQALPALLSKALSTGRRIVVKAHNEKEVERLNSHLWSYNSSGFLPHGSAKDGRESEQPIWITAEDENPNGAEILILTHGVEAENISGFSLCCEIFDGRNEEALNLARTRWKTYKDTDYDLTYWKQNASGGWEKI